MLELVYLVLCEDVIVDQKSRASLINIFDNVNTEKLPVANPRFKIAFKTSVNKDLQIDSDEIKIIVTVQGPNKEQLAEAEAEAPATTFKPGKGVASAIDFGGIVLKNYGPHTVTLKIGDIFTHSITFTVKKK